MIFEDDAPRSIVLPLILPRGLGGYNMNFEDGEAVADTSWIAPAINLIPSGISALAEARRTDVPYATVKAPVFIFGDKDNTPSGLAEEHAASLTGSNTPADLNGLYSKGHLTIVGARTSTILHEYGHLLDDIAHLPTLDNKDWLSATLALNAYFQEANPGIPASVYGKGNSVEWFAELFTSQVKPDGYSGAYTNLFPRSQLLTLAGGDEALAGEIRAWFRDRFPSLPLVSWRSTWSRIPGSTVETLGTRLPCITGYRFAPATLGEPMAVDLLNEEATIPVNWSIVSGALPPGMTLQAIDGFNARLSGVVETPGDYNFTVRAASQANASINVNRPYRCLIFDPAVSAPVYDGPEHLDFYLYRQANTQLEAVSTSAVTWGVVPGSGRTNVDGMSLSGRNGEWAENLALSSTGLVTGEPYLQGNAWPFYVTLRMTNLGGITEHEVSYTIWEPVVWPSTTTFPGSLIRGVAVDRYLPVTGHGFENCIVSAGALPAGLSIAQTPTNEDPRWRITGTPTTAGAFSFTLSMTNPTTFVRTKTFSGTVFG